MDCSADIAKVKSIEHDTQKKGRSGSFATVISGFNGAAPGNPTSGGAIVNPTKKPKGKS